MDIFLSYLKDRSYLLGLFVLLFITFLLVFSLYHLDLESVFYPSLICLFEILCFLLFDFLKYKSIHKKLFTIHSKIDVQDNKLPDALDQIQKDYQSILSEIVDEVQRNTSDTSKKYDDMIQYYTIWVHQIKTPIASMRLHLQNEDTPFSRKILLDLNRIEQYSNMVMTYLRLQSDMTDYVFQKYDLDKILRKSIRYFSNEFIDRKIKLNYAPVHTEVLTDEKWLSFVIEQLLSNALKYTKSGSISISFDSNKVLHIQDTGIGISKADLPRIFEKGYTGLNG